MQVGLGCLLVSSDLLVDERLIEPMVECVLTLARGIVEQYFGILLMTRGPEDAWLLQGLAGWLQGQVVKQVRVMTAVCCMLLLWWLAPGTHTLICDVSTAFLTNLEVHAAALAAPMQRVCRALQPTIACNSCCTCIPSGVGRQ